MVCAVEECDRNVLARGWCEKHYRRWYRHGDVGVVLQTGARPRPVETPGVKACTRCGETKVLDDFSVLPTGIQGRNPWCKECRNRWARDRRRR